MNSQKPFISLSIKMAGSVLLGIALAICMYFCCTWIEQTVTNHKYQSETAIEKNLDAAYESLNAYIADNQVKATDTKALSNWIKSQEYTYFFVYDNYNTLFEAGWWMSSQEKSAEEEFTVTDTLYSEGEMRIDRDSFVTDVHNRIVNFADGEYYTYIEVYPEAEWQILMKFITMGMSFLTLLMTVLIYTGRLLKRVANLSANIQEVSDGNLDHRVVGLHNDELGALAVSVDNMRTSIIRIHQNEKDAWQANHQLITEMSHDIRTPLTSMIGYLDIIEGQKYSTPEELEKYIDACRGKAFELKDMSDDLFQYFLVYGMKEDTPLEKFDAGILFQQLLMEHSAELIDKGYTVDFHFDLPEADIMVELSGVKRLYNNLFSNIMKYADPNETVFIDAACEKGQMKITLSNTIAESAKKVESNKIGLKTCEKICQTFNGIFTYEEDETSFITKVSLPVVLK